VHRLKCSNMGQHAWAGYLGSPKVELLLWKSRERLKLAWGRDQKDPKSYPMNTYLALIEIENSLTNPLGASPRTRLSTKLKIPRTLWELISEKTVKAIWEDNHNRSFEEAIAQATPTHYDEVRKSQKVFKAIIRAIELAYVVDYVSWQLLPTPKVNILHKGLNEIAKAAGIKDQTEAGFAGFLDDLCPCGLKRHREAVRKLSGRSTRMRRPKE
jgi:hypothetical protein